MKQCIASLALLLVITTGCKKSSEADKVCFTRTNNELKIKNNSKGQIYFTSFSQNLLPLINWVSVCSDNYVGARSSLAQNLSAMTGYSDNEKLVVFWWTCSESNHGEIQNVALDKNQTECR